MDQEELTTARRKLNADLRSRPGDNEIERLATIHFHMVMEEDEELRMEGANETDIYASVARQVEAAGCRVNFSSLEIRAEFGPGSVPMERLPIEAGLRFSLRNAWEIVMTHFDPSEQEWEIIAPLLPNKPPGVPRTPEPRVLNGIFYIP